MKLYTVGYLGWKMDKLAERLKTLGDDFRVFDVRHSPYSRDAQFSRAGFAGQFGNMYVHAKGFGNLNYRGGPIQLADPEPWYKFAIRDMKEGLPVILLCACWNLQECHRLIVANEIERRAGIKAEHLTKTPAKKKEPKEKNQTLF